MTKTLSIAALCTTILAGCAMGPQPQTATYGSGETKENYLIENGQKNGPYTKYFMSGVIKEEGSYKDGQIDGFMTTYHENGNKAEVAKLHMGKFIETKSTYDENGNLVFTGPVNSHGQFDGLVLQYDAKGIKQYRSHYKNGVLDGTTQAFNSDGKVTISYEYVNGIPQSLTTLYDLTTGFKREEYIHKDGDANGPFTRFDNKGKVIGKGRYIKGKIDGVYTEYDENGTKTTTTPYKNGVIEGTQITYYPSGAVFMKQEYRDGQGAKDWNTYYESGERHSEYSFLSHNRFYETQYYKSGKVKLYRTIDADQKLHGELVGFYENGQKKLQGNYSNNVASGLFTTWHDNGKIEKQLNFSKGKADGVAQSYDYTGHLIERTMYSEGTRTGLSYVKELDNAWGFYSNGSIAMVLSNATKLGNTVVSPWREGMTAVADDNHAINLSISSSQGGSQEVYFSLYNASRNVCFSESKTPEQKVIKVGNQNIKALRWCYKVGSENVYYYNYVAQTPSGKSYVEKTFKAASGSLKVTLEGQTFSVPTNGFTKQWNNAGGNAL